MDSWLLAAHQKKCIHHHQETLVTRRLSGRIEFKIIHHPVSVKLMKWQKSKQAEVTPGDAS